MSQVFFTEEHEFIEILAPNKARIGITAFAAEQLGDIVHVELPEVDDEFDAEEEIVTVESVKSVSEVYAPFAGKVVAINEELEDAPETVNEDAQGKGWFFEIETEEDIDTSAFLTEEPAE
ncbi:glycine cleavage system protein GcvH [Facklamia miroungae]|uniref:Glycine cleavage system H protein n=1 Tax=Facklamia miroungae TaxID=120956 RepID=A0A1G7TJX0_9LACT|nr:glycine cleavage system protein GcvH [Facklamia miroungae]NKZ29808.1 glycine cleavage system protein GcvH [Facklamia miroungae]SDG35575.1 glycine cleavage system H protein [Facklamia miroungae]